MHYESWVYADSSIFMYADDWVVFLLSLIETKDEEVNCDAKNCSGDGNYDEFF